MKTKRRRKLTITVENSVYRGLHKGYCGMAADEAREAEAAEWGEGLVGDVADEPR